MYEVNAVERGRPLLKEKCTNYEFECLGMPPNEVTELCTLRHAFPRVAQKLYPNEHLDANSATREGQPGDGLVRGLSNHHPIEMGFKTMSKSDVKNACLIHLQKMEILLGMDYANPLDIGSNTMTWALGMIHQDAPQTSASRWNRPTTWYMCICFGAQRAGNQ